MARQVKSKQRVADHGEVFTADREVNAMLDLVKQETERVDSRFLEPACGDGNFLAEILRRKLEAAKKRAIPPRKKKPLPLEFEKQSVIAVASIYGVDLMMDNVLACRDRLYGIWNDEYEAICKKEVNEDCREAVRFILSRNIVCGNTLSLKEVDENGNDTEEPIVFSEWSFVMGTKMQRKDYRFDKLLAGEYEPSANAKKRRKFDVIIGNPPYQLSDGGGTGKSAKPIYQLFVQQAKRMKPRYMSMIIPSRWFSGGKGLDDFRAEMLSDKHIRKLVDYDNFKEVFPGVDLAGGACFFLWDRDNPGSCEVTNVSGDIRNTAIRELDEYDTFIRSNQAVNIVNKVNALNYKKHLSDVVYSRLPFGIPTTYTPLDAGVPCYFTQRIGLRHVRRSDMSDSFGIINKWKFLVPKAPIAGQTDFSKPVAFYYDGNTRIAKPGEICSESWLVAGAFDTEEETLAYKSYIFTKVVRFLLLQTVVSQNISKKNYCFIPDLGKYEGRYSDEQLCDLWNISPEEYEYIKSKIGEIGGEDK